MNPEMFAHPTPCVSPAVLRLFPQARNITPRECEVVHLLARGVRRARIAERLGISPTTVHNHLQNVMRKLDVHSQVELVALAYRNRLIKP